MESRFDEIAAFADIGDFIDQPVKTYSSGMMMRLAFAVNTCVDPDILIVDEALSVGDAPFQAKCFRRLRNLIENGVSLLFVSHDIGTVRSICGRALWLKNGKTEMWGDAKEVAREYEKFCWSEQGVKLNSSDSSPTDNVESIKTTFSKTNSAVPATIIDTLLESAEAFSMQYKDRYGIGGLRINNFQLFDTDNTPVKIVKYNQNITAAWLIKSSASIVGQFRIGLRILDLRQDFILSVSDLTGSPDIATKEGEKFIVTITFPANLTHGKYVLNTAIFCILRKEMKSEYDFSTAEIHDSIDNIRPFEVTPNTPIPAVGPIHHSRGYNIIKI